MQPNYLGPRIISYKGISESPVVLGCVHPSETCYTVDTWLLRFLQIKFFTMAMVDFVRVRRPIHTTMVRKECYAVF